MPGVRAFRYVLTQLQLSRALQRGSYASIAAQGRADPACRSHRGSHAGGAGSGRTASPIFQSVSFRQGQDLNFPVAGFETRLVSAGRRFDHVINKDEVFGTHRV